MCLHCNADCREELQKAEVVFADPGILKAHVASVSHARWIHSTAAGEWLIRACNKYRKTCAACLWRKGIMMLVCETCLHASLL